MARSVPGDGRGHPRGARERPALTAEVGAGSSVCNASHMLSPYHERSAISSRARLSSGDDVRGRSNARAPPVRRLTGSVCRVRCRGRQARPAWRKPGSRQSACDLLGDPACVSVARPCPQHSQPNYFCKVAIFPLRAPFRDIKLSISEQRGSTHKPDTSRRLLRGDT